MGDASELSGPDRSIDNDEKFVRLDMLTLLDANLSNDPGLRRNDRHFQLHRLDHDQPVTLLDGVTGAHANPDDFG